MIIEIQSFEMRTYKNTRTILNITRKVSAVGLIIVVGLFALRGLKLKTAFIIIKHKKSIIITTASTTYKKCIPVKHSTLSFTISTLLSLHFRISIITSLIGTRKKTHKLLVTYDVNDTANA